MRGSVALVTGAARGIGRQVAEELAYSGADVVAVDAAPLGDEEPALPAGAGRILRRQADVAVPAAIDAVVDEVERDLGPVDHLVHCAGVLRPSSIAACTDDDWATTLAVNATGVFVVTRAVLPRMIARCRGAMVTVASNAARVPRTSMAAYAASKAASVAFTKCAALEAARSGVRCNIVLPGSTDSPMLRALWDGEDRMEPTISGDLASFRLGIPLGRIASPVDVAAAVLFLLSDRARHITMHELVVDGGATLGA